MWASVERARPTEISCGQPPFPVLHKLRLGGPGYKQMRLLCEVLRTYLTPCSAAAETNAVSLEPVAYLSIVSANHAHACRRCRHEIECVQTPPPACTHHRSPAVSVCQLRSRTRPILLTQPTHQLCNRIPCSPDIAWSGRARIPVRLLRRKPPKHGWRGRPRRASGCCDCPLVKTVSGPIFRIVSADYWQRVSPPPFQVSKQTLKAP